MNDQNTMTKSKRAKLRERTIELAVELQAIHVVLEKHRMSTREEIEIYAHYVQTGKTPRNTILFKSTVVGIDRAVGHSGDYYSEDCLFRSVVFIERDRLRFSYLYMRSNEAMDELWKRFSAIYNKEIKRINELLRKDERERQRKKESQKKSRNPSQGVAEFPLEDGGRYDLSKG